MSWIPGGMSSQYICEPHTSWTINLLYLQSSFLLGLSVLIFSRLNYTLSPTLQIGAQVCFWFTTVSQASQATTIIVSTSSLTSFSLHRTLSTHDIGESQGLSRGGLKSKTSQFQLCVKKKGDTPIEAMFWPQITLTLTCNHFIQLSCA